MPRVHTQVARADIYAQGKMVPDPKTKSGKRLDRSKPASKDDKIIVNKGQTYYWWKFRYGGKHISTTRPKPSQLTQSDYLSQLYTLQEQLADVSNLDSAEEIKSAIEDIVSELENLKSETEDKLSNMPDSLQSSPTGELLQERVDALDGAISELEGIDLDYEEPDEDELRDELIDDVTEEPDEEEVEADDFDEDEWKKEHVTEEMIEEKKTEKFQEWKDEKMGEIEGVCLE
jgi:hypothetical protein